MNKYQEAKAWLDKINANPQWNRVDIEEPALSQLTELVERATPKKPILKIEKALLFGMMADSHRMNSYEIKKYCCPRCNKVLYKKWLDKSSGTKFNYCHKCGQALDWGG